MSDESNDIAIESALAACAHADQILSRVEDLDVDDEAIAPWQAAHVWMFRAMCLLIDSLEGVEDTSFSDEERIPVSVTRQPYSHLAGRYRALMDRYQDLAHQHED